MQGVGFRPFVYRLATGRGLRGWVSNSSRGLSLEVEGSPDTLRDFLVRLEADRPPRSFIQSLESTWLDPVGYASFEIRPSDESGEKSALILPDLATCPECVREIFDPANRRHLYPFTNCTNCGPRFSIIETLPYDRGGTSMRGFAMCGLCQAEYDNPLDRRFHAQPNACPSCGPHLELWNPAGAVLYTRHPALLAAAESIRQGRIVALKGLGGFHLLVAARDEAAVQRLRTRKGREEKPFALMFPSLAQVRSSCLVEAMEERLLRSPEAPIVLLRRRRDGPGPVPDLVAPRNPYLGVMLPYTPLHHLLLAELEVPVVATSGNLSDEPICTDEQEALSRLANIADLFLVHNRPIVRHLDDSIARVMLGRELILRRARGYAPLPVALGSARPPGPGASAAGDKAPVESGGLSDKSASFLAAGAHLKNTIALSVGPQVFLSQHIGDLETEAALAAFRRVVSDLQRLYEVKPLAVAADAHPDYLSTRFARQTGLPLILVQHHYAHVLACMAENDLQPPALGVSWDGTGYGSDGTIWGGEFLRVGQSGFERLAHLRVFPLPGGDQAVKEPRRSALGLLFEGWGGAVFDRTDLAPLRAFRLQELAVLIQALPKKLNTPLTSSVGRLFDAVSSLLDLRQVARFEGQAAMELEFLLDETQTTEAYPLPIREPASAAASLVLDWHPLVEAVLAEAGAGVAPGLISARFHNALAASILEVARRSGEQRVVLSGGCFQNRYLTERAVHLLQAGGFSPYWHQRVPPNDGGVALGQIIAAARGAITY